MHLQFFLNDFSGFPTSTAFLKLCITFWTLFGIFSNWIINIELVTFNWHNKQKKEALTIYESVLNLIKINTCKSMSLRTSSLNPSSSLRTLGIEWYRAGEIGWSCSKFTALTCKNCLSWDRRIWTNAGQFCLKVLKEENEFKGLFFQPVNISILSKASILKNSFNIR